MQLSILTSILQSRLLCSAQSRVLGQVQQQQQHKLIQYGIIIIHLPAVCVYCVVGVAL